MVARIGVEPIFFTGGGERPEPLDERAKLLNGCIHRQCKPDELALCWLIEDHALVNTIR